MSQVPGDTLIVNIDREKLATVIYKKANSLEEKLTKKSHKILDKCQRQEERLYRKILKTSDSLKARLALTDVKNHYENLRDKLKNPGSLVSESTYIAKLDTLRTLLKYLDESKAGGAVKTAIKSTQNLQAKFNQAEQIKQFINERKRLLKQHLEGLGMMKDLKKLNKEIYYYGAQLKEYREILKDSKKAERKAIQLLSKTKAFREFMKKNSQFSSLFRVQGDEPLTAQSLAGLQTRAQVNALIQQQVASAGANGMQQLGVNLQAAQSQLQNLQNKILKSGQNSSQDIMPDGFRPNEEKTKTFWKRLEWGTNIQSVKGNGWWPTTSDLGWSLGYKLSGKNIIGIGGSYKLGWGNNIRNIRLSHQGASVRSFIDWKLKGSFWVTGGYEANYRTVFNSIAELRELNAWQQSGLLGLSKTVSVKSKFFKKTKLQMLWDFLSYQQVPATPALIFRIGYSF